MTENEMISVLIVDDHPVVRDGIKTNLQNCESIEVLGETPSGEEAAELAEELSPDVVIMDMKLTDMSGIEAINLIQAKSPDSQILVLSMYDDRNFVMESVKAGARGYLLKERSVDEDLINAVLQVHKGGAFFDPTVSDYLLQSEREDAEEEIELTEREIEVLTLIAEGYINKEIASKLFLSVRTIEAHRESLMRKLEIHGAADLTKYAIEHGFIQVDIKPTTPPVSATDSET